MTRNILRALVVGLCVALAAFGLGQVPATGAGQARTDGSSGPPTTRVIVQQWDPDSPVPRQTVMELGGEVTRSLPIVDGFAATLPAGAAEVIAELPEVRAVTPDTRVTVQLDEVAAAEDLDGAAGGPDGVSDGPEDDPPQERSLLEQLTSIFRDRERDPVAPERTTGTPTPAPATEEHEGSSQGPGDAAQEPGQATPDTTADTAPDAAPERDGVPGTPTPDAEGREDAAQEPAGATGEPARGEPARAPQAAAQRSVYRDTVGADRMGARGVNGNGVVVALVDTGVADIADLNGRTVEVGSGLGRDRRCVNLSGERNCDDNYGHGTFMAGLIAGSGYASRGAHTGVAPGARILSVKVAGRDGAADVSTVLTGIQWVVNYSDTYGIRILNLSLGTDSTHSYRSDPFNRAVQEAWDAGIAVVVAASNRGPAPGTIGKPGDDPLVMTVGAVDDRGTATPADDRLPDFSSRGPTAADGLPKPDLVAPGAFVTSLRSPGSLIDTETGGGGAYLRGSGTSMGTAVVSGTAALTLAAAPSMTPDQLKFALTETATPVASTDRNATGAGVPSAAAALRAPEGTANQGVRRSSAVDLTDPALLDLSRGNVRVEVIPAGSGGPTGTRSATHLLAEPLRLTGMWTPEVWALAAWPMNRLLTVRWSGTDWRGKNWQGASFYGQHETTPEYGQTMPGSTWHGVFGK